MVQITTREVDWEDRWSREAHLKQLPSLHGIVSTFGVMPGVIGMHGGLPPSDSFPFSFFTAGITAAAEGMPQDELHITDPKLVAAAQQYNMHAQGHAPLVSWAHDMVSSLHHPATLQPQPSGSSSSSTTTTGAAPIGMKVVITQGSSAGLEALFRMLLNPGDPVLLEEYTYAHVVEADLLPMGCELLSIWLDEGGLVPEHLDQILTERQAAGLALPRVLYTIPTGQNPTGSIMTRERMQQVYSLAQKWDLVVIEDDAYYWLQYPDGPDNVPGLSLRPGFLSVDVDGRVVRLDTLAKLLGPGFRLGWLAGPPELATKFALYTAGTSIGANMLSQVMIHQLLSKWGREGFEDFVRRLQRRYAQQAAVAEAAAAQQLSGLAEWQPVKAGMFMWCKMTGPNADSSSLVAASAAEGVMIIPGHLISVTHLEAAAKQRQLEKLQARARKQQQQQDNGLEQCSCQVAKANQLAAAAVNGNATSCIVVQQCCFDKPLAPSPYFRLSFVSVGPAAIQEGVARLRKAIIACNSAAAQPGIVPVASGPHAAQPDCQASQPGGQAEAATTQREVLLEAKPERHQITVTASAHGASAAAAEAAAAIVARNSRGSCSGVQCDAAPQIALPECEVGTACVAQVAAAAAAAASCMHSPQALPDLVEACEVGSPCVQRLLGIREVATPAAPHVLAT